MAPHYGTFAATPPPNSVETAPEEQPQQVPKPRFEAEASWWSRVVFAHVAYLFEIVNHRPLALQDVWQLEPSCTSREVLARLRQRYFGHSNCSLRGAIWRMEWKGFVLSGLLLSLSIPCVLGPAVLLYVMLTSLVWQANDRIQVFLYLGAFHLFTNSASMLRCHALLLMARMSNRITACCHSLIFQSALSNPLGHKNDIAGLTSLYSSDVKALGNWIHQFHGVWVTLLELSGQIYILDRILNAQFFIVLTGLIIVVVIVLIGTGIETRLQRRSTETTTARWKVINECFRCVQSMKLNAWEPKFEKKINEARDVEQKSLFWIMGAVVFRMSVSWCAEDLLVAAAFIVFVLKQQTLDPAFAFSIIVLSQQIKVTIIASISSMLALRNGIHGVRSIERHLDMVAMRQKQNRPAIHTNSGKYSSDTVIATHSACFGFDSDYVLMNVNIHVNRGELVIVYGNSGGGKTNLLMALLGEVKCMNGEVFVSGECRVVYCPQESWVQSITIRENILFGSPYDETKYFAVLDACSLIEDLSVFPNGDSTVIGPRGINLSGGQKARIALARACYADADLYVLDCPLASVDAVVQMDVFRKCIVELLRYKTVVLATHNVEFIHSGMVDRLMQVRQKTVSVQGCDDTATSCGIASQRVTAYESSFWGPYRGSGNAPDQSKNGIYPSSVSSSDTRCLVLGEISSRTKTSMRSIMQQQMNATPRHELMALQDGYCSMDTIKLYFSESNCTRAFAAAGCGFTLICVAFLIAKNFWLAWWSSSEVTAADVTFRDALVYAAFVLGAFWSLAIALLFLSLSTSTASNRAFANMLHAILYAPFSFFYWTPTGQVLNRFFMDVHVTDHSLMWPISYVFIAGSSLVGTFLVLWYLLGWVGIVLTIAVLGIVIRTKVIDVLVSISLLGANNDSCDVTLVSEALEGLSVIRAFGSAAVERFVLDHGGRIDNEHRLSIVGVSLSNYEILTFTNVQGLVIIALAILLANERPEAPTSAAMLGLAMIYILSLHTHAMTLVTGWYNFVYRLVSVNRLLAFSSVQPEERSVACSDPGWLSRGEIVFERVWFRYSEKENDPLAQPYALKNVSFAITPGSRIGVVGRTGSGKSSLAMALLRVHELVRGRIMVDGTDVSCLQLHALRSKLCIISQTPMFYRCTVREYLDPFDEFSDNDLWQVLHKTGLSSFVQTLQTELHENGENWSLGQRQLLCLARSLLRPSKIVILDEPFSSIDGESDKQLLSVLSSEFNGSTVLFVTHRLDQVLDFCEKILVLKDGEVEDFGVVEELVGRSDGVFFELLENTLLTM